MNTSSGDGILNQLDSEGSPMKLSVLDLAVFFGMLGVSSIIGCYFGCCSGNNNSAQEYLMGGKNMRIIPVSLSLTASYVSGISMLGMPSEIYRFGTQMVISLITVQLVCATIAFLYMPIYSELQLNSCYQYLELRFEARAKKMASILFVISQLLYIPIVIYVPALAFSQVTGINVHSITPLTSLVCIFYTTLGGLRAVVWTDTLQVSLMFLALVVVVILGANEVGGWQKVWEISEHGQRLQLFNMNPNPLERYSFWSVLVGMYFQFLSECGFGQGFVQRYLSVPTLRAAQWTLLWFAVGLALIPVFCGLLGLLMYATYHDCDPLSAGHVRQPDQLLPLYVTHVASHIPGMSGLFVASVFSAALSSMSTGLNSMSGVLIEDICGNRLPTRFSKATWLRIAAACLGFLCIVLVYVVENLGGVLQAAFSLSGVTAGTMLGLFSIGMFVPMANSKGALWGSIASLCIMSVIVGGNQMAIASGSLRYATMPASVAGCPPGTATNLTVTSHIRTDNDAVWPVFRISYMYYSMIGTCIVFLIGIPVSYWSRDEKKERELDERMFSPVIRHYLWRRRHHQHHEIPCSNLTVSTNSTKQEIKPLMQAMQTKPA